MLVPCAGLNFGLEKASVCDEEKKVKKQMNNLTSLRNI